MLDIQYIRKNKEKVAEAVKNKNLSLDVEALLAKDAERVKLQQEIEELLSIKNDINDLIQQAKTPEERTEIIEKGKDIKKQLEEKEPIFQKAQEEFMTLMQLVPNVPSEDTPIGKDETENKVLRQVGETPKFDFQPKEHWELGENLGLIDLERAVKVSGTRFAYLKSDLVMLELALLQYVLSIVTSEEKIKAILTEKNIDLPSKPFVPVLPPVLVKTETMSRMARLEPREERYYIESDDLFLVGSAEHALGALHMDETLQEENLPIRYIGFSPAFRREAGSYSKDMKGILRVHQFNKLEMEVFGLPEQGLAEQNLIVAIQEKIVQDLGLAYQVVAICTGDMGKPDARQIDIETWLPGQDKYRETHTSDYMTDYQARRLNTRVKRAEGKTEFVHMNDATAFAGRTLIAILENYQQADGSVRIPEVLRPYVGKDVIAPK